MNYWVVLGLLIIYQLGRLSLGLVVHPYRTMREVVRSRWLAPVAGAPGGLLIALLIVSRLGAMVVDVPGDLRNKLAAMLLAATIGLMLWQMELGYLGWRFWKARASG